jgi:hypothetical protein
MRGYIHMKFNKNHKVFKGLKHCIIEFGEGAYLRIYSGGCEEYKTQSENNETFEVLNYYEGFKGYVPIDVINNMIQ